MKHLTPTDPVPAHGSVVLTNGATGTAYQRHFSTGLFHSVKYPAGITFHALHAVAGHQGVLLVHDTTALVDPEDLG